jgi:hypothetical protein
MVDLEGVNGLYAIALTEINPFLEGVVFDLPSVALWQKRTSSDTR